MSAAFDRETELPRATAGDIAVNNLASARHHVWSRFLDVPERPGLAESIVELEGMTIEFLSDFGALDRLGMLADQLTLMEVDPARTAVIQAQVASASHRFDLARDHLSRARFLGAPDDAVTRVSLGIDQACGARLEQVLTIRRAIAAETGKLEDRVPLGALLADLREFDEADRVYRSALRDYRDVSPFALAWVCFQLGVLWGELASERQAARAAQWYRQAIAYLPAYVKARVHLAEIYLSDGRPSDAEALLIPARSSGDPEVFWRLGDVLTAMGRASEAEEHLREAREGFETNYHPSYLFAALLLLAAGLAMFMDSITVMLFLAALTLPLCRLLKVDPVTFIIAEVCAANTGGSATLVGDPPNVILGTTLGFNFADFAAHTGPISALAALALLGVFYWSNRMALRSAHKLLTPETVQEIENIQRDPLHARMTRIGLSAFGVAVLLLVTHHWIVEATGWPISAGVAALVPAGLALLLLPGGERKSVILRVDGESIVFFAGLFVLIGGLEKSHVFEGLATFLAASTAGNPAGLVMALHWGPGLLSGVVDNVPLALAMSYVLRDLAQLPGMPALGLMVWSLALGVNMGGNLTPIGASANVVAYAYMEKNNGPVGWKRWMTAVWAPTFVTMLLATGLVFLKGRFGWY